MPAIARHLEPQHPDGPALARISREVDSMRRRLAEMSEVGAAIAVLRETREIERIVGPLYDELLQESGKSDAQLLAAATYAHEAIVELRREVSDRMRALSRDDAGAAAS